MELVEWVYVSLGGSARLGLGGGTVVRLLLATLVLGVVWGPLFRLAEDATFFF